MQVRAGGPAGGAHQANGLALAHALAALHVDLAQVRIHRFVVVAVLDEDHVAVAILHAGKLHHTVAHRSRGCAGGGGKVGAQVRTPLLQNRVKAHRKTAADARELHR